MKLVVSRSQADVKGMLGGHKGVNFTLTYRLVLTEEERELVDRYKLNNFALTWTNTAQGRVPDDTIANMVVGRSQTLGDVTTLVNNEEIVKNACDQLPALFSVVRTFGGEEVINYPRSMIAMIRGSPIPHDWQTGWPKMWRQSGFDLLAANMSLSPRW